MLKNIFIGIVSLLIISITLSPLFFAYDLSSKASVMELMPKEEVQFSQQYFALIQAHNLAAAKEHMGMEIPESKRDEVLNQLAGFMPNQPRSIKTIGAHTLNMNGVSTTSISSEYEFNDHWLLTSIVLRQEANTFRVLGLHINPMDDSLENLTRFHFLGQSTLHYLVFAGSLLVLLFDIYAFALVIKTPIPKRKWLWIIFILAGFGAINFNWLTGQFTFSVLTANIPVVRLSQMLYEPFFISVSLPLGAIMFILKRKKWLAGQS